jgi:hypothetical protein
MFKFFRGLQSVNRDQYNGVTNSYLIQMSYDILTYSDWIFSIILTNNNGKTEDRLKVDFKDIDGLEYTCLIFEDRSFVIAQIISLPNGEIEFIDSMDFSEEILSDVENILSYFKNMPRTIANSL